MPTQMKTTLLSISLLAALGGVPNASATLINGDFSTNDFTGWSVQVETCIVCDGSDDQTTVTANPGNETHHDASSGAAHIETDDLSFQTRDVFAVTLFQAFTMDSLGGPGETLTLSLDLSWSLDDPDDLLIAQLEDKSATPLSTLDLSSGGPFDVTAFAGRPVEIAFGLQDLSFSALRDTLDVDNIRIIKTAAVPGPTPMWLIAAGLLGLGGVRRSARS